MGRLLEKEIRLFIILLIIPAADGFLGRAAPAAAGRNYNDCNAQSSLADSLSSVSSAVDCGSDAVW